MQAYFGTLAAIQMDEGTHLCTTLVCMGYTTVGYLFQKLMFTF